MRKRVLHLVMIVAMGIALAACGGNNNAAPENGSGIETPDNGAGNEAGNGGGLDDGLNDGDGNGEEPGLGDGSDGNEGEGGQDVDEEPAEEGTSRYVMNALVDQSERPAFIEADDQMLKDMYRLDGELFEDYIVLMPMMNISTTEFAVFRVKDAKDIPAVEEGVKKRAEDVQKSFESYLPDQYENAKNYKLVAEGNYVLFVIAEDAEAVAAEFAEIVK